MASTETVVAVSEGMRIWLAPAVSCAVLELRLDAPKRDPPLESDLLTLTRGEPDPHLFEVPSHFRETSPSMVRALSLGSASAHRLDDYYNTHQR